MLWALSVSPDIFDGRVYTYLHSWDRRHFGTLASVWSAVESWCQHCIAINVTPRIIMLCEVLVLVLVLVLLMLCTVTMATAGKAMSQYGHLTTMAMQLVYKYKLPWPRSVISLRVLKCNLLNTNSEQSVSKSSHFCQKEIYFTMWAVVCYQCATCKIWVCRKSWWQFEICNLVWPQLAQ